MPVTKAASWDDAIVFVLHNGESSVPFESDLRNLLAMNDVICSIIES